jgi:hypothetical protein
MRSVLLLALLASIASPALAAPRHPDDAEAARMAERLNDPRLQSAMSGMMIAMADMMMSLRIDGMRDAMRRIDPDAGDFGGDARTLGEAMTRDDPDFRDRLAGQARGGTAMMGSMASGMATMLPELRAMGDRIARDVERTARRFPGR